MGNLFATIPDPLPHELVDVLLRIGGLRLERIVSRGHATPPGEWYDQPEHEWVVLLRGRAGLRFEDDGAMLTLEPGDYVDIAAHRRHRVEWTDAHQPTIWLALHCRPEPGVR